jgi:hypothetical protein
MKNAYRILVRNLKGRGHFRDLGVGWRIILKWIRTKNGMIIWGEIM